LCILFFLLPFVTNLWEASTRRVTYLRRRKTLQLLRTEFYDNRYDFKFSILRFPFIGINIPIVPAYGVYISQLIRYSRVVEKKDGIFNDPKPKEKKKYNNL
jgi:hypothetical protein